MSEPENEPTTEADAPKAPAARPTPTLQNPLGRPTDAAVRPGFRSPANKASKAQSKKKDRDRRSR